MSESPPSLSGARFRAACWTLAALVVLLALVAIQLRWQGRAWWCSCASPQLWWGDVQSGHCSQHLLDPYSFTHLSHGLIFYGVIAWRFPRLPIAWRFLLVTIIESLWEVIENSQFVIDRYRTETTGLGYEGDSIANSLADIACCDIGVALARSLGLRSSVALFVLLELALLAWIRDNLTLNVVMLLCPIDAVQAWQARGG